MVKKIILFSLFLLLPTLAHAQSAATGNKLVFDQPAPDLATANTYVYKYYPDGAAANGITLTPTTCVNATPPFTCTVAFPAFTPGAHTLTITASNTAGESPKSTVFSFTFVVIPATPTNIRIQ